MDHTPIDSPEETTLSKSLQESSEKTQPMGDGLLPRKRIQLWLHRVLVLLLVFVCAAMGVLLLILPWRPEWTDNHFLFASPGLRAFVSNGFVRGICSGLGLLDIWIGFGEAIHYHESNRC